MKKINGNTALHVCTTHTCVKKGVEGTHVKLDVLLYGSKIPVCINLYDTLVASNIQPMCQSSCIHFICTTMLSLMPTFFP